MLRRLTPGTPLHRADEPPHLVCGKLARMKANILRLFAFLLIAPALAGDAQMVVVPGKDVQGEVFKRLGLPNQTYCWEQCLEEARCTGVRWAALPGSTAGQCQLISGPLSFIEPREIKTEDGQQIRVIASKRVPLDPKK
jgi:hypothetical protein